MQQLSMEYKTKDYANNILQKFQFYAILISVQSKPMYNKGMYIDSWSMQFTDRNNLGMKLLKFFLRQDSVVKPVFSCSKNTIYVLLYTKLRILELQFFSI